MDPNTAKLDQNALAKVCDVWAKIAKKYPDLPVQPNPDGTWPWGRTTDAAPFPVIPPTLTADEYMRVILAVEEAGDEALLVKVMLSLPPNFLGTYGVRLTPVRRRN